MPKIGSTKGTRKLQEKGQKPVLREKGNRGKRTEDLDPDEWGLGHLSKRGLKARLRTQ